MTKVLLVDDDAEFLEMLRDYLGGEGFDVGTAGDGEAGLAEALSGTYELVVLDVMMPRLSGLDALRQLRAKSCVPVIMLTARGDDVDRILGLELGADDYVPKPCTARELVARIRAILRRSSGNIGAAVQEAREGVAVGALVMYPSQRRALWRGVELELTGAEFNILELLVRNAGRTVSKEDLCLKGLGRPLQRFDRSVDTHVSSIRQKLGVRPNGSSYIRTIYRGGYQFIKE
ncbi:MAG: response regulator transcription factor [Betaproteobacteria bacterium]|nr:response regulator transcription factor [Betaproteobacteria bacterium]